MNSNLICENIIDEISMNVISLCAAGVRKCVVHENLNVKYHLLQSHEKKKTMYDIPLVMYCKEFCTLVKI